MAFDPNYFNNLRQAILDKITSKETTIQEAYFEQPASFQGSPAAVIGVSNNEALYNSSTIDRVTFVFHIMIYIPIREGENLHDVELNMGLAYWEVFHMFNQRNCLSGLADIVEPLPSTWGYEERGDGILRYSELNLRCVTFTSNLNQLP